MKILWVTSELRPFAMAGGLGDVSFALPNALYNLDHDIRVILPYYTVTKRFIETNKIPTEVLLNFADLDNLPIKVYQCVHNSLKIFLVEHEIFQVSQIYDENLLAERFTLFSWTIVKFLENHDWNPDIIHANDWPTAPSMAFIHQYRQENNLQRPSTIFTIHNLAYQGNVHLHKLVKYRLNSKYYQDLIDSGSEEMVRYLRIGIKWCDKITTVSKTYAREILTPKYGYGLENELGSHFTPVSGITHGIDTKEWDPKNDPFIRQYSISNLDKKNDNKIELQNKANLKVDREIFTIGLVSRLVYQKGLDLVSEIIPVLDENIQLLILGTGEAHIEKTLIDLQQKNADKFALFLEFDPKLSHQFFAGLDAFLIPSRYEPCGLTQLYAMRYGTLPIVRHTGGLADTVSEKMMPQTGFVFENYEKDEFLEAIYRARDCFQNNKKRWIEIQKYCLKQDFSWSKPAKEWSMLYEDLIRSRK